MYYNDVRWKGFVYVCPSGKKRHSSFKYSEYEACELGWMYYHVKGSVPSGGGGSFKYVSQGLHWDWKLSGLGCGVCNLKKWRGHFLADLTKGFNRFMPFCNFSQEFRIFQEGLKLFPQNIVNANSEVVAGTCVFLVLNKAPISTL